MNKAIAPLAEQIGRTMILAAAQLALDESADTSDCFKVIEYDLKHALTLLNL